MTRADGHELQFTTLEADCVGSVPMPARVKGMASTLLDKIKGHKPELLIDKLGERMAYERTGVRLYEAMIVKTGADADGPMIPIAERKRIRDEEQSHFQLVAHQLQSIGADPTAMTPCADVVGVAAAGYVQVINDPRITVPQALKSILMNEFGDNAGWELLIERAEESGHTHMAEEFTTALHHEREHLATVQGWLRQAVLAEGT